MDLEGPGFVHNRLFLNLHSWEAMTLGLGMIELQGVGSNQKDSLLTSWQREGIAKSVVETEGLGTKANNSMRERRLNSFKDFKCLHIALQT